MMKSLLIIIAVILAGSYIVTQTSCNGKAGSYLQPQLTIADLKANQSIYADSLITLYDVKVKNSESILNYCRALIEDKSGESILLLGDRPFKSGETINIRGKLVVLYQTDNKSYLVFIDSHFKPMKNLLKFIPYLDFN
jgi:hypothetical protein